MLCDKLVIRHANKEDADAIRDVEQTAFKTKSESELVESLVSGPDKTISLVAECDGVIIGHVLLSEIGAPVKSMALAPLAVVSEYREMRVGSRLVRAAIDAADHAGYRAIFVLGDTGYYERFGFSAKRAKPFRAPWSGPNFMALELKSGALDGKSGRLTHPDPFLAAV